jgi:hypothetical protein
MQSESPLTLPLPNFAQRLATLTLPSYVADSADFRRLARLNDGVTPSLFLSIVHYCTPPPHAVDPSDIQSDYYFRALSPTRPTLTPPPPPSFIQPNLTPP